MKIKSVTKSKDAFTRYSVTTFSSILDSLNTSTEKSYRELWFRVTADFDKCFVPNKFVKWVANVVDYKSGNIVVDGKIILLIKESIHCVLGIPIGGNSFPSNTACGKEVVLNKFQKNSIPSVKFFANNLEKGEELSDEDVFICFIIVPLSSFLCPNSSITSSPKHFGIFADIARVKDFDRSGYVLDDWLLDSIKLFKKSKSSRVKDNRTLGGCLYYLAVSFVSFFFSPFFCQYAYNLCAGRGGGGVLDAPINTACFDVFYNMFRVASYYFFT
jgi:hypothetical protein